MLKKVLLTILVASIIGCSENPREKIENKVEEHKVESEIQSPEIQAPDMESPFIEPSRYMKEINPSDLNILVQSQFHKIKTLEDQLEDKIGSDITFHYRHFFVDADIKNHSEFDAIITMENSPLEKSIESKKEILTIGTDRLALAVRSDISEFYGMNSKLRWTDIINGSNENDIKIQIANPAWDLSAYTSWLSYRGNDKVEQSNVSEFNHGSLRKILPKIENGKYSAAWMMESTSRKLTKSYLAQNNENPFVYYFIEGPQIQPHYKLYSINDDKEKTIKLFKNAISSKDMKIKLEEITGIKIINKDNDFSRVTLKRKQNNESTKILTQDIDDYIANNYPDIHTIYLVPNSKLARDNDLTRKFKNTLHSMTKENKNIFETISSARENDKVTIISYDDNVSVVENDLQLNEITKTDLDNYLNVPASDDANTPYFALGEVVTYARMLRSKDDTQLFRIVHIASDNYGSEKETNSIYADFAEGYKKDLISGKVSRTIEISNVGLANASLENLNGITGHSGGISINGNKIRLKRAIFIIKNNY